MDTPPFGKRLCNFVGQITLTFFFSFLYLLSFYMAYVMPDFDHPQIHPNIEQTG